MTVTLDALTFDAVIDFNAEQASKIAIPDWLNQTPDIDANVWSKNKERLDYVLRMNNGDLNVLKTLKNSCSLLTFSDDIYGFSGNAWIEDIQSSQTNDEDWSHPWKVTLTLIVQ